MLTLWFSDFIIFVAFEVATGVCKLGVVYVIVNSAFENYVKISKTTNLQQRLRSLDNTSVPLPFRCLYAVEVDDENHVEHLLHQVFADH